MPSIIDTLEQEELWYGQDGFPYRIKDMELSHITNVLAFLRRRTLTLSQQAAWLELQRVNGERVPTIFEFQDEWRRQVGDGSAAWLERRPLIKALKYELLLRDTVDGEVLEPQAELPTGEP